MSLVSQKGKVELYERATLKKLNEFQFPAAALSSHLNREDDRLLVLTADQIAYVFRTAAQAQPAQTAAN